MMWLDAKQYAFVVSATADWTMDQLVAFTYKLASIDPSSGLGVVKRALEDIAQGEI
jgi:hypothetical protein